MALNSILKISISQNANCDNMVGFLESDHNYLVISVRNFWVNLRKPGFHFCG